MTDEAYTFRQTEIERKRTARGAFSKKGGSRSKKCSLPSDNMPKKIWEELNGVVYTYDTSKPMHWSVFTKMPLDLQREYLKKLIINYGGRKVDVATMFGIRKESLTNYINRNWKGWTPFGGKGAKPPVAASLEWVRFINSKSVDMQEVSTPPEEEKSPPETTSCVKLQEETPTFALASGELHFVGNLRVILSKMLIVLEPSADYDLTISFVKKDTAES